ncbi:uncharacterized protein LOC133821768 [Humulus lupulus]|uniref:uncharacterized protein LOC133821768 n=1 Tax=Humulus lupulus TaxID=3486 RepID=UPI002B4054FD|nr:uncharacterized protein LOC133821768 [Humulus lupulus]
MSLAYFSSTSAYCNQLKSLADQLSNVGGPVSDQHLVLRLLAGLTEAYSRFVTVMQQKDHLPTFAMACSRLKLEETMIKERAARDSGSTSLLSVDDDSSSQPPQQNGNNTNSQIRNNNNNNRGKKNNRGRGNNNRSRRGGRGGGGGGDSAVRGGAQQPPYKAYSPYHQPFFSPWAGWAQPSCPYPTASWKPHSPPPRQSGVLGPRPQQAYSALVAPSTIRYTPTNINAAMHTLALSQPHENWYMDTGATSHMTTDSCTLSSYFNSSKNHHIVVGNGFANREPSNEV